MTKNTDLKDKCNKGKSMEKKWQNGNVYTSSTSGGNGALSGVTFYSDTCISYSGISLIN